MLKDFLGEEPDSKYFLIDQGVAVEEVVKEVKEEVDVEVKSSRKKKRRII